MTDVSPDHPLRQMTLIMVPGVDGQAIAELAVFVAELAFSRSWLIGPPAFSSSFDDPANLEPDEVPINVAGVTLEIYSELPPHVLTAEIQQQQNEDITAFLRAIEGFSKAHSADFEMFLDREQFGGIENGELIEEGIEGWLVDIENEPD